MKISFDVEKKYVYAVIGLLVLFGGVFAVNAFGGVNPAVMGHSVGEIDFSGGFNVPSGNVGIGTATPSQKLDINGNVRASGNMMAAAYCDENGQNCNTAGAGRLIASGTGSNGCTASLIADVNNAVLNGYVPFFVCRKNTIIGYTESILIFTSRAKMNQRVFNADNYEIIRFYNSISSSSISSVSCSNNMANWILSNLKCDTWKLYK